MNWKCLVLSILGAAAGLSIIVGGGIGLIWALNHFPEWVGLTIVLGCLLSIFTNILYKVCKHNAEFALVQQQNAEWVRKLNVGVSTNRKV